MANLLEPLERDRPDALRRRVQSAEAGELLLEPFELLVQRIVLGVVDLGLIEDVVQVGVVVYLLAKPRGAHSAPLRIRHFSPSPPSSPQRSAES